MNCQHPCGALVLIMLLLSDLVCTPQLQHALLQTSICLCAAAAAYFDGAPLSWTWWGMQKVYQVAYEKVQ